MGRRRSRGSKGPGTETSTWGRSWRLLQLQMPGQSLGGGRKSCQQGSLSKLSSPSFSLPHLNPQTLQPGETGSPECHLGVQSDHLRSFTPAGLRVPICMSLAPQHFPRAQDERNTAQFSGGLCPGLLTSSHQSISC